MVWRDRFNTMSLRPGPHKFPGDYIFSWDLTIPLYLDPICISYQLVSLEGTRAVFSSARHQPCELIKSQLIGMKSERQSG